MALSLLDRVKNKALEALQGVGNFVSQEFQRSPLGQNIQTIQKAAPVVQQQVQQKGPDLWKAISDVIANSSNAIGSQPIINNPTPFKLKLPTISQTLNPNDLNAPIIGDIRKANVKRFEDVLSKTPTTLTPDQQKDPLLVSLDKQSRYMNSPEGVSDFALGTIAAPEKLVAGKVAEEAAPVVKKTAELFKDASKGVGETVTKVVEDIGNPFKTATNFGSKPNKYMQLVGEAPRVFKKYFGGQWENVKKAYFDPLDYAKADAVDFKNTFNKVISDLKIKAGSRTSALIQQFGEGKVSADELIRKVGIKEADRIANADKVFREVYDTTLDQVNALRKTAGLPEIPKRVDYYRHMNEGGGTFWDSLVNGGARGEKSTSIGKQRVGSDTKFDAVKGFADYIERAAHAGFIEPQAVKFEGLAKELSQNKNVPADLVKELNDYTKSQIRGIREPLSSSEGLNAVASGINKIGGVVRANRIIGNVSSILAQSLNLPLAISDAGVGATLRGVANFPKNIKLINESPFIKDRLYSQPLKFSTGLTKLKGYGGKVLQEADGAASRLITSMYYEKALSQGLKGKEALKWAGDEARLTIGGRGIGDFSKFQQTSAGQFIAPFTLEVQSGLNRLGEKVADKEVKALVGYFVMTTGINDAYEKLTGQRPLPDPIETALDMYRSATGTDGKNQSWLKVAGRALAGATEFMPIAQNAMAFGYPIVSEFLKDEKGNSYLPDSREIFGSDDPTRFGSAKMYLPTDSVVTGNRPLDLALNAVLQYTPTGYGGQAKKTLSGVIADAKGYTESKAGNVLHPLKQDPLTRAQTAVFGPWSTEESKKFFDNENPNFLTKSQSNTIKKGGGTQSLFDKFIGKNQQNEANTITWTNENGFDETVNLSPTDNSGKEGIAAYKQGTSNASKAVKLWGAPNDQVPDEVKIEAYKKLGFEPDDVRYAYKAGFTNDEKTAYIIDKNLPHDELIKSLTTGRVESIQGKYFAANGVLDNLYEEGLISDAERDYLKKIKVGQDGKLATSSLGALKGTGLTPAKLKALLKSLNSLYKDPIATKQAKGITPQEVAKPKFASKKQSTGGGSKSTNQWFNAY